MRNNHNLLLVIDLGNTSATYGLFEGETLIADGYVKSDNFPFFYSLVNKSGVYKPIDKVIISSVSPKNSINIQKALSRRLGVRSIYLVGKHVKPRVSMRYKADQLGADRLVNIYGAKEFYKLPLLIIDSGTAITFDYVSKKGIFEGGLIVPGIETSFYNLQERTALLPKLKEVSSIKGLVGHDTKSAMFSGLLNGFGALADGLIGRFKSEYGRNLKVLLTGGFATRIAPYMSQVDYLDPLHTIRSLALMYRKEIELSCR